MAEARNFRWRAQRLAIRQQACAQDRRLASLRLRQGGCRCVATAHTSAGCRRRACALPIRRTFRPVVSRISQKPFWDASHSPAFALQHLLFCDATKIALPLNRFRIGLGMTALGAMKVATCPKTGAPSHNKYAAVSGALGSALPWRQSNRARRRIIRFHRPLLACALRLRACESGPGHEAQYTRLFRS